MLFAVVLIPMREESKVIVIIIRTWAIQPISFAGLPCVPDSFGWKSVRMTPDTLGAGGRRPSQRSGQQMNASAGDRACWASSWSPQRRLSGRSCQRCSCTLCRCFRKFLADRSSSPWNKNQQWWYSQKWTHNCPAFPTPGRSKGCSWSCSLLFRRSNGSASSPNDPF